MTLDSLKATQRYRVYSLRVKTGRSGGVLVEKLEMMLKGNAKSLVI